MINLLVASDKEFQTIRTLFSTVVGVKETKCLNTIAGYYNDTQISVYQIGIGKVNACTVAHYISEVEGEVINIGTCCSLLDGLQIGQPVQVAAYCQWDFDIRDGAGICVSNFLNIQKYATLGHPIMSPFTKVVCATGDKFVTEVEASYIDENFTGAHIVDMEFAALARFFKNNRPIDGYKVVSDYANLGQYENNWNKVTEGFKKILDYLTVGRYENN